jgi:anti-sigma factor RsiW
MDDRCPKLFDETLLSGHLDGELTQAAEQRVRIHLEDCEHCRELHREFARIREATMTTEFIKDPDRQWNERPRGAASWIGYHLGWIVAVVWFAVTCGYGLWQVWIDSVGWFERTLVFGGLAALVLLFASVAIDRLRSARTDPYREVDK